MYIYVDARATNSRRSQGAAGTEQTPKAQQKIIGINSRGRVALLQRQIVSLFGHFHARTSMQGGKKRQTTRTESVHRPFHSCHCVQFFLFSFVPFFSSSSLLLNCLTRLTSGHWFTRDAGPCARVMSDEWELSAVGGGSIGDQAEEKRTKFAQNFVCVFFIYLSRNKRFRREKRRGKDNFIISQTITARGSFFLFFFEQKQNCNGCFLFLFFPLTSPPLFLFIPCSLFPAMYQNSQRLTAALSSSKMPIFSLFGFNSSSHQMCNK